MLTPYLNQILQKTPLTKLQAEEAMDIILKGCDPHQAAAFLMLLQYRGETPEEVTGMVRSIGKRAVPVHMTGPVLDIVGTGGDMARTVNISTGSAILAAACGIPIAKHGNRSVSSMSGSADVLEALGIEIDIPPEKLAICLQKTNMAFMYAPSYHPCLKQLTPLRKALKLPTAFNLLGPLLNPARAEFALIGVAKESYLELMAQAMLHIGTIKKGLVFHGSGLDELTTIGKVQGYLIKEGSMSPIEINPADLGFLPCRLQELQGGDAKMNASLLREAFSGKPGALADALAFTAGAALWIFEPSTSLQAGVLRAQSALKEGKALELLEQLSHISRSLKCKKNYLDEIMNHKKNEVSLLIQASERIPHPMAAATASQKNNRHKRFSEALKRPGLSVIAEVKRSSPSRGQIRKIVDPAQLAREYCNGGAAAISVLTDEKYFNGSMQDLECIAQSVTIPILRKDFIIHPLQLAEAAKAGASAVLLIARLLKNDLRIFIEEACRLGLEALVEIHDRDDLELALQAGAEIIGINHRDLNTFELDLGISEKLRPLIPPHILTVAESGIFNADQAQKMRDLGYDAILVGEALVRSENPSILLRQLQGGRSES